MESSKILCIIFYIISLLIGILTLAAGGVQACPDELWRDFDQIKQTYRNQYYALFIHTVVAASIIIVASIMCLILTFDVMQARLRYKLGLLLTITTIIFYFSAGVANAVSYNIYYQTNNTPAEQLKDTMRPYYNLLNATLADAILIFLLAIPLLIVAAVITYKNLDQKMPVFDSKPIQMNSNQNL